MRKTKAVKQVCILLAMVLMFSTINTHVTATPATPETNDASHYSEAAPALNEVDAMYIMHEADNLPERSIVTEYTQVRNVAQREPTQGTFDGWYFYMFFDPDVGLYYVPDFGLHFDPTIPMFYAAHLDLWLENHTIACASESTEVISTYRLDRAEMQVETYNQTTWADPDEEHYYNTHGRLRNLADYLNASEYRMFRLLNMPLEDFLSSGMAGGMHRAFSESGNTGGTTREQFETFYTTGIWQETYEAVRAFDMDLEEYEAMLARSGMTFSEWVAGSMISGSTLTDIRASLEFQLTLDLRSHSVSFSWSGGMHEEEQQAAFNAIAPLSANWPQMTLYPIASGGIRHNEVVLTGRIGNLSASRITMHGFWVAGGNLPPRHGETLGAPAFATYTHVVGGLAPNTAYSVRAVARNVASGIHTGQSPDPVGRFTTRATTPSAPQNVRTNTNAGVGTVQLQWAAPQSTGGVNITRYEVQLNNGQWIQANGIASHTFNNVSPGTHAFRVRAVNSVGFGTAARVDASARFDVPSLTGSLVSSTQSSATISGTIYNNGGAPINFRGSWHRLTTQTQQIQTSSNTTSNTFNVTINNLVPNTAYVARAVARNSGNSNMGQSDPAIQFTTQQNQVTLTFNGNGGTPSTPTLIRTAGIAIGTLPTATRPGHTFVGWFNAAGVQLTTTTIVPISNTTYTARWTANTVTLTFSANGGTTSTPTLTRTVGTQMGTLPTATRAGHTFVGWFNAAGVLLTTTTTVPVSNTTYTARWTANTVTLTFNANGGTTPTPTLSRTVGTQIGTLPTATRAGHTFVGWFNAAGVLLTTTTTVPVSNTTYTARWTVNEVTLTFSAIGGTPATQTITRPIGSGNVIGTLPPNPTRPNHRFIAWYTVSAATDGSRVTSNTSVPVVNTTYFARWESTVTFNANGGEFDFTMPASAYDITNDGWIYNREEFVGREELYITDEMLEENELFYIGDGRLLTPMSTTTIPRPVVSGTRVGALPQNVRRENYTLMGWLPTRTGTVTITADTIVNGNTTFYALWQRNPIITDPATELQTVLQANLPVTWQTVPNATHRLSLFDMSTNNPPRAVINNRTVTGGSFTIPASYFVAGRSYRVEVIATVAERNTFGSRVFTVRNYTNTITRPATNNQAVPFEDLVVEWSGIPGATYRLTLINRTTGGVVINNRTISGRTNERIPVSQLVGGNDYTVEVTSVLGTQTVSTTRTFSVLQPLPPPQAGITVTVLDNLGRPLSGALVQFVHSTGSRNFHTTNANGIVFLPNAAAGRWGINVTHPNFASTPETSTPYTWRAVRGTNRRVSDFVRDSVNQVDTWTFTMSEPASTFRNLGWENYMQHMNNPSNQAVTSVYGWRYWHGDVTWHMGIDMGSRNNTIGEGRRVRNPLPYVEGAAAGENPEVVQRLLNSDARGYSVTVRYRCRDTGTFYFVRHMHLQHRPAREDSNGNRTTHLETGYLVYSGEVVGRMGGTNGTTAGGAVHLHVEVLRSYSYNFMHVSSSSNLQRKSIDPRAFFAPDFAIPW